MLRKIWIFLFLLANNLAMAADNFDVSTNILTAPQVRVADTLYFDVQLKVASIVSIGSAVAAETSDTYNTLNKQLNIPVVTVGTDTYYNAIITVGTILKVGASCTIDSTCSTSLALLSMDFLFMRAMVTPTRTAPLAVQL